MKTAKKERNRTRNEAVAAYNKAYNYTSAHPISQFTNKTKKQKSNDLWADYYDKQKVADTAKDNYKQVVKENKKAKEESIKKAVSKYSKAYDEASDMSDSADEKWRAAREQYEKLGKTRVSRIIAAAKNETSDAKKYSKLYDEASSMADVADEKWREVNSLYIQTGKTRVSRVINNFKYR